MQLLIDVFLGWPVYAHYGNFLPYVCHSLIKLPLYINICRKVYILVNLTYLLLTLNQQYSKETLSKMEKQKDAKKDPKEIKESKNTDLSKELAEKSQKIEELTDTLKRLQAEFENYKKRTDKEKLELMKYAQGELMLKLLPVLDTFEIALKSTKDHEKFAKGMEMVYAQLYSAFESSGLRPIKAAGEKFNPFKHEVLMKEECSRDEDIVLDELQKGYMLHDRVLRHSKVKISCKKADSEKE